VHFFSLRGIIGLCKLVNAGCSGKTVHFIFVQYVIHPKENLIGMSEKLGQKS